MGQASKCAASRLASSASTGWAILTRSATTPAPGVTWCRRPHSSTGASAGSPGSDAIKPLAAAARCFGSGAKGPSIAALKRAQHGATAPLAWLAMIASIIPAARSGGNSATAPGKERESGRDPRLVSERRQRGEETRQLRRLVVCHAITQLIVIVAVANTVPIHFGPGIEHMSGEFMRLGPKCRIMPRAVVDPSRCQRLEIGQCRCRAGLIDHREPPFAGPKHQGGAAVRALEGGAFVTRGLVEMLLVGLHVLEGIVRRDLALLDRNFSERNRLAVGALPFGQILEALEHLALLELIIVVVMAAVTAPV